MGGLDGGVHFGLRILHLLGEIGSDLVGLHIHGGDRRVGGLPVRLHLGLQIGAHLISLIRRRLCLLARIIDTRLRILTNLLALLDHLIRLRGSSIGVLLRLLHSLLNLAGVHERQLIAVLVDAVRAVLRAIADDDVRVTACRNAHGADLVRLLSQGQSHGLHPKAQAEDIIIGIQFDMRSHAYLRKIQAMGSSMASKIKLTLSDWSPLICMRRHS